MNINVSPTICPLLQSDQLLLIEMPRRLSSIYSLIRWLRRAEKDTILTSTSIRQLFSVRWPEAKCDSLPRSLRSATSPIGRMSKFGCMVRRALKKGSKDALGQRALF